jgi:hypothetical protein
LALLHLLHYLLRGARRPAVGAIGARLLIGLVGGRLDDDWWFFHLVVFVIGHGAGAG